MMAAFLLSNPLPLLVKHEPDWSECEHDGTAPGHETLTRWLRTSAGKEDRPACPHRFLLRVQITIQKGARFTRSLGM